MLRIATRKSALALWQANYVKSLLEKAHAKLRVEIIPFVTEGDRLLSAKLADFGGKGLFVKEIEQALMQNEADIAVHSMKDMPADIPESLMLGAICEREDPRDAFVSNRYTLQTLPQVAKIGTSSLRRQCEIKRLRDDLTMVNLRGNVDSRLRKLDEDEFDAIILAAAGLKRLGLEERITQYLDSDIFIPAVGQGAVGIECRRDDSEVLDLIVYLNHAPTESCVKAERAVNARLGGGCHAPIAAYAVYNDGNFALKAMVANVTTGEYIEAQSVGNDPLEVGYAAAQQLIELGARRILD